VLDHERLRGVEVTGLDSEMDSLALGSVEDVEVAVPKENRGAPFDVREVKDAPAQPVAASDHVNTERVTEPIEGDPSKLKTITILFVSGVLFTAALTGFVLLVIKAATP